MAQRQDYVGSRYSNGNGNGHHSSEQIKRQVDQTRSEMDATIDALIDRLDPAAILSKTVRGLISGSSSAAGKTAHAAGKTAHVAGHAAGEAGHLASQAGHSLESMGENLLDKARENPVPTAMIALGAAWLLMDRGESSHHEYQDSFLYDLDDDPSLGERSKDKIKSAASSVKHGYQEARDKVGEKAHDVADASRHAGRVARRKTRRGIHKAEQGYATAMRKAPLAVGGIALGIGLLCGVLIPETETEDEWMGSTRDDLMDRGKDVAREARDRGMHAAAAAADAASENLHEEGLGPDDLKEKLSHTVEAASESAKEDWKDSESHS